MTDTLQMYTQTDKHRQTNSQTDKHTDRQTGNHLLLALLLPEDGVVMGSSERVQP